MDKIVRKHLKQKLVKGSKAKYFEKSYNIYTKEEADERKIDYVYWQDCEPWEYGCTDDNYVAQCLKKRNYNGRVNLVFPFGQIFINTTGNSRLLYEPHKRNNSFSMVSAKPAWETKKGKTIYKNFAKIYAAMSLQGSIDYGILADVLGKSDKTPVAKTKRLLKKDWMKEMIDKEIKKHLDKRGVDEGTVLDMIDTAYKTAKEKDDPSNMLRSAENLINILGMKASNKPNPDHLELEGVSLESIANALDPDKQIEGIAEEE